MPRYVLTAGHFRDRGRWVAVGSLLTIDEAEAARLRSGGCVLDPVEADGASGMAPPDVSLEQPAPAEPPADEAAPAKPARRPRRRAAAEPEA